MENAKNRNLTVWLVKISLIAVFLLGVMICAWWYPFSVSLTAVGLTPGEAPEISPAQYAEFWTQVGFYWLASLPCFVTVGIGWRISTLIKNGREPSREAAGLMKTCFVIMLSDCLTFIAAQAAFCALGWNDLWFIHFFAAGVGLLATLALKLAADQMLNAAMLKEENEAYI